MNYRYLQNTVYRVKKLGMKEYILYYSIYIKLSEWQIQSTMEECRSVVGWVRGSGRQIDREEAQENFWRWGGASWVYTFVKSHWSLPLNVCNLLYIINNTSIKFILLKKNKVLWNCSAIVRVRFKWAITIVLNTMLRKSRYNGSTWWKQLTQIRGL